MELTSLAQLGRLEKEFEINKELKVKLHTLNSEEQQKALLSVSDSYPNEVAKSSHFQTCILTLATSEVNGEKVKEEELKEFYKVIQYPLLVQIFANYLELAEEQGKVLVELKKK